MMTAGSDSLGKGQQLQLRYQDALPGSKQTPTKVSFDGIMTQPTTIQSGPLESLKADPRAVRGTNFKMKDGVQELQRQTIMGDGLSNDLVLQDFVYQGFPGFLPGTENVLW